MSVHKLGCQLHAPAYSLQSDSHQARQQIPCSYSQVESESTLPCARTNGYSPQPAKSSQQHLFRTTAIRVCILHSHMYAALYLKVSQLKFYDIILVFQRQ